MLRALFGDNFGFIWATCCIANKSKNDDKWKDAFMMWLFTALLYPVFLMGAIWNLVFWCQLLSAPAPARIYKPPTQVIDAGEARRKQELAQMQ